MFSHNLKEHTHIRLWSLLGTCHKLTFIFWRNDSKDNHWLKKFSNWEHSFCAQLDKLFPINWSEVPKVTICPQN